MILGKVIKYVRLLDFVLSGQYSSFIYFLVFASLSFPFEIFTFFLLSKFINIFLNNDLSDNLSFGLNFDNFVLKNIPFAEVNLIFGYALLLVCVASISMILKLILLYKIQVFGADLDLRLIKNAFKKSKGQIICLLVADDFFDNKKSIKYFLFLICIGICLLTSMLKLGGAGKT